MKNLSRALFFGLFAVANAASPSLQYIFPPGGQLGKDHAVTFRGARLQDTVDVLFYDAGITVADLKADPKGSSVTAVFKVAPDCEPGWKRLRLRTKSGLSELRMFSVGMYPDVAEATTGNDDFEQAQALTLNCTVNGRLKNEDVDYFKVDLRKGEVLCAEVEGLRLGYAMLDPYLAVLDANRFELDVSDDHPLLQQDSLVSITAPADGTYYLLLRDSSYLGNDNFAYRLHVGNFPRPTAAKPAGVVRGQETGLKWLGIEQGEFEQKIKRDGADEWQWVYAEKDGRKSPTPNLIRVADFPSVIETATNNHSRSTPQIVDPEPPFAINGVVHAPGLTDWYRFKAKKDQTYHVRAFSRQLRSALDPVLAIYMAEGEKKYLKANDDSVGPDSYIEFKAPADMTYDLYVRDHLKQGSPEMAYRVEITPAKPKLTFNFPNFRRNSQDRQHIAVPRGNRYATYFNVKRDRFGGELKMLAKNLPPGVVMHAPPIAANLTQYPVIFEATLEAESKGHLIDLEASTVDEKLNVKGHYEQHVELVYGQPNNAVYHRTRTDKLPLAVTEEIPVKVTLHQPKVPIVHGGSMDLKISLERKNDYKGKVYLYMLYRPPGISATSVVTIPEGKTEATYRINANGGAGERTYKLAVLGRFDPNGQLWFASNFIDLNCSKPFVGGTIDMATAEQGQPTEVVCKLTQNLPFEGEATIQLLGLPAQVKAEPMKVTRDMKEVVFPVTTTAKSPKGHHKSLFCSLVITKNGEPIQQSFGGGGQLRIDPPPKKPTPAAAKAAPKKPTEKRLTRLEKLRLAKEQEKAGK